MINIDENKIYFNPGDKVKVRHFEDAPIMYVIEKVTKNLAKHASDNESIFIGIKTRWFDKENRLQEAIFSTKDLEHIK
jgi:hypothetical protein